MCRVVWNWCNITACCIRKHFMPKFWKEGKEGRVALPQHTKKGTKFKILKAAFNYRRAGKVSKWIGAHIASPARTKREYSAAEVGTCFCASSVGSARYSVQFRRFPMLSLNSPLFNEARISKNIWSVQFSIIQWAVMIKSCFFMFFYLYRHLSEIRNLLKTFFSHSNAPLEHLAISFNIHRSMKQRSAKIHTWVRSLPTGGGRIS